MSLVSYLPQAAGLLPKWQLFVAATAIFNTIQNFTTLKLTRKVYGRVPPHTVTSLQARTFAIWTLTSAIVRGYSAYYIHQKSIYEITLATYFIALGHFGSEFAFYGTAGVQGLLGPLIVSTTSIIWMLKQYDFYVTA